MLCAPCCGPLAVGCMQPPPSKAGPRWSATLSSVKAATATSSSTQAPHDATRRMLANPSHVRWAATLSTAAGRPPPALAAPASQQTSAQSHKSQRPSPSAPAPIHGRPCSAAQAQAHPPLLPGSRPAAGRFGRLLHAGSWRSSGTLSRHCYPPAITSVTSRLFGTLLCRSAAVPHVSFGALSCLLWHAAAAWLPLSPQPLLFCPLSLPVL